jgi:glycosyltransferase involved in cell wall biosynthesis
MDAGLPIVATARGGQTDFLHAGRNALLVPPGETEQLAAAVRQLLDNPELARRMGQHNKEHVRQFYLAQVAGKFEEVLTHAAQTYARRH